MVQIGVMADLQHICQLLQDRGHNVLYRESCGQIMSDEGSVCFTGNYVSFLLNPNLYYFKDDPTAAADFIDKGCHTLIWTEANLRSSLECERDSLYFACRLYYSLAEKENISTDEAQSIFTLFKDSVRELLNQYSRQYGLKYNSVGWNAKGRIEGSYSHSGHIKLNTTLIVRNPNYIKGVLLHELCHSVYPNHRMKFWKLLSELMKDAGLSEISGYVNRELFTVRKDYYIGIPIIRGGPDDRYINCMRILPLTVHGVTSYSK